MGGIGKEGDPWNEVFEMVENEFKIGEDADELFEHIYNSYAYKLSGLEKVRLKLACTLMIKEKGHDLAWSMLHDAKNFKSWKNMAYSMVDDFLDKIESGLSAYELLRMNSIIKGWYYYCRQNGFSEEDAIDDLILDKEFDPEFVLIAFKEQ